MEQNITKQRTYHATNTKGNFEFSVIINLPKKKK